MPAWEWVTLMKVRGMCIGGYNDGRMVDGWKDLVLCLAEPLEVGRLPTLKNLGKICDTMAIRKEYYRPIEFHANGHTVWFFAADGMDGNDVLLKLIKHYRP